MIRELDGVRGVAILLVLIVHFGDYAPTHDFLAARIFRGVVGFGWTGVDLFFVLSGCLITGILLDAKGSPNYFRSFYMRRVLRILPLYYAAVAAFFLLFLPIAHALHAAVPGSESEQPWFWFYLSNWRLAFHMNIAPPLGHFWTLAIEEQFYLVWPLLLFVIPERRLLYLCPVIAAVVLACRCLPPFQAMQSRYPEFLYNLTPFRIDSLAIGAWAAAVLRNSRWRRNTSRWIAFSLLLGGFGTAAAIAAGRSVRYYSAAMSSFGYTAIDLVCLGLVLFAAFRSGQNQLVSRFLRQRELRKLGKYSYGIYVLHWPIAGTIANFFQDHVPAAGGLVAALLALLTGIGVSCLLSLASWNLLEKHFLRLKRFFPYERTVIQ